MSTMLQAIGMRLRAQQRPLRFLVAGAANTAFGLAIYPALVLASGWFQQHYLVALLLAQGVSVAFAFLTYRIALGGNGDVAREIGLFSTFYLFNYALNWAALPVLVERLRLRPEVAQTGYALVLMIAAYLWHSRVTFRSRT